MFVDDKPFFNNGNSNNGESTTLPSTYILVDDSGEEYVATVVENETIFTATANDVREGMVCATDGGVITGTKVIPSYNTSEGFKVIPAGSAVKVRNNDYQYSKLQALLCTFNTSVSDSVATEKVAINDNVYAVQSVDSLSVIVKNDADGSIDFGIINDTDKPQILRYFFFKEIY